LKGKLGFELTEQHMKKLSMIVTVGDGVYRELMQEGLFAHKYFTNVKGSLYTKLIQRQCEIESRDKDFQFTFTEREFGYGHIIPELQLPNLIMHFGRSQSADQLPHKAAHKVELSNANHPVYRQLRINTDLEPPHESGPYYAIVTFGTKYSLDFITMQFPAPGYFGIADSIVLPLVADEKGEAETIKRKKAILKKEVASMSEEGVS